MSRPKEEILSVATTGGLRFNANKLKLSLVPSSLKRAIASVLQTSAKEFGGKYPMHNWRLGLPWTDTMDSLERHLEAFKDGEDLDPDSGLPHVYHIACNAAFLVEYYEKHKALDDRFKPKG